jgi:hypothetical protein
MTVPGGIVVAPAVVAPAVVELPPVFVFAQAGEDDLTNEFQVVAIGLSKDWRLIVHHNSGVPRAACQKRTMRSGLVSGR